MRKRLALCALGLLAAAAGAQDETKSELEQPTAAALAPSHAETAPNRTVAPGRVRWHATFDDARTAAARSGRPVLLFQMLGRLDQELC